MAKSWNIQEEQEQQKSGLAYRAFVKANKSMQDDVKLSIVTLPYAFNIDLWTTKIPCPYHLVFKTCHKQA